MSRTESGRMEARPAATQANDTSADGPVRRPVGDVAVAQQLRVPHPLLEEAFQHLRACGRGRAECQVLWVGPWGDPSIVTEVVHPVHRGHRGGFLLDDGWLTRFWLRLAERGEGIRAQVHTHPRDAFHSETDDAWPIVHLERFLSLVIPDFGMSSVGLDRTYLAEIGADGEFHEVDPFSRLMIF